MSSGKPARGMSQEDVRLSWVSGFGYKRIANTWWMNVIRGASGIRRMSAETAVHAIFGGKGMVQQWKVGILLFNEVETLDFAGPFEVLSITVYPGSNIKPFGVEAVA